MGELVEGKSTDVEESFKETVEDIVYIIELAGLKAFILIIGNANQYIIILILAHIK